MQGSSWSAAASWAAACCTILAKEGWTDCVLMEKAELTSGSTWHAAGQITHSLGNYAIAKMAGYGIELYQSPGRRDRAVGHLPQVRLAAAWPIRAREVDYLHQIVSIGASLGASLWRSSGPPEIAKVHPVL